jgi:hypothetical protein
MKCCCHNCMRLNAFRPAQVAFCVAVLAASPHVTPPDSWHNWHNYFPQTVYHVMPISRLRGAKSPLLPKSSRLTQHTLLFTCYLVFAVATPITHLLNTCLMLPARWNIKTCVLWFTYMQFTRYFLITFTQLKQLILILQLHMCDIISQFCALLFRIFPWRWPRNAEMCRRLAIWQLDTFCVELLCRRWKKNYKNHSSNSRPCHSSL